MNRIKLAALSLLGIVVVSLSGVLVANAQDFRSGDNVTVGESETIDSTLFIAGGTLNIDADVNGDVFCAGQTVTINATVRGDVICAAQTLIVKGQIDGDVRLAGQTVTLDADVDGNATIAAETFTFERTSTVWGDMAVGSNDVTLKGEVGRDAAVGGRYITLAGIVGRNVTLSSENGARLTSDALIAGNFNYTSHATLQRDGGSEVTGAVTRIDPPVDNRHKPGDEIWTAIMMFVYCLTAMLIVAITLVFFLPNVFIRMTNQAFPTPWKALLTGFVAAIVTPIVMVLLAVTIVGIPLGFMIGTTGLLVLLLSIPTFSYYIGRLVMPKATRPVATMLIGVTIVLITLFVPLLNVVVFLAALWIGSGMILLEAFRRMPRLSYGQKKIEVKTKKKA